MAETYTITVHHSGPWVGCEGEETYALGEMGYTDEDWDALTPKEQQDFIEEVSEQEFWNAGYEYSGKVNRG